MRGRHKTQGEGQNAKVRRTWDGRGGLLSASLLLTAYCLLLTSDSGAAFARRDDGPVAAASGLLEKGAASKLVAAAATTSVTPSELKIVSYNIRYRSGEDLEELIRLLKTDAEIGGASIIGLQEVDRRKKRSKFTNTARVLAEALGMHYVWAAPPNPRPKDDDDDDDDDDEEEKEEETGVAILSAYPLSDVEHLVLAHEGPNRRRRAGVGATARVGTEDVRFYSVHAETRMPIEKKVEHWRTVLEDLGKYSRVRRVIIVGDFNTIKGKDVRAARKLFTDAGFTTPFSDEHATFKVFLLDFKLDWVWLRGFEPVAHGIDKGVGLSDHWPLWTKVKFARQAATGSNGE